MLGKTHVSAGMAASLLVLQPVSIAPLACALLGGALGGWISDIDVRGAKLVRGTIVSVCVAALAFASRFLAEVLPGSPALQAIAPEMGPASVVGAALFAGVTLFGSFTAHRTFTHSIVGCALWYVAVCLLWPQIAPAFGIGLCAISSLTCSTKPPRGQCNCSFPSRRACASTYAVLTALQTRSSGALPLLCASCTWDGWFSRVSNLALTGKLSGKLPELTTGRSWERWPDWLFRESSGTPCVGSLVGPLKSAVCVQAH